MKNEMVRYPPALAKTKNVSLRVEKSQMGFKGNRPNTTKFLVLDWQGLAGAGRDWQERLKGAEKQQLAGAGKNGKG